VDREPPQPPSGAPADDGDGGRSVVTPDWMDDQDWARVCDQIAARDDGPSDGEEPGADPEEWRPESVAEVTAEAEADGAQDAAIMDRMVAAGLGGWAHYRGGPRHPGIKDGPAGGFGQGESWDNAAPDTMISSVADYASGPDRRFTGVNDDELMGLIGTRQRLIARQHWELLMGVAEFIRRRPEPGCKASLPGAMPRVWGEHAAGELRNQLHVTLHAANDLLGLAHDLAAKLPRTSAALRDGIIDPEKARTISLYCSPLTPEEAAAFEEILFGIEDLEEMTWGMVRDRVAQAVITVNPEAARKRREKAEKDKRVELVPEASGNCQLAGRELPAAAALAAMENLNVRALELRRAGVPGGMDELRALAYLEKLGAANPLDTIPNRETDPEADPDSGQGAPESSTDPDDGTDGNGTDPQSGTGDDPDGDDPDGGGGNGGHGGNGPRPGGPRGGAGVAPGQVPAGFRARVNLTIPLTTALRLSDRPGIMSGVGPVDPALARDLAAAAARDPRSTWCITVTGPDGRPVAHGCGRPPPRSAKPGTTRTDRTDRDGPAPGGGPDPPGPDPPGPDTIRLNIAALTGTTGTTGAGATGVLVFELDNLAGPCDHKFEAKGHDPGVKLRHLTGILNACCTSPPCRRPHETSDYEHSTPHEQGGRTCLCQAGPVCRHDHRAKQAPGWHLEPGENRGWFRWTTPSGRTYLSRPTQYPD
jgi:hypothetical protein